MLIRIPGVLTPQQVGAFREQLATANWQHGRGSAGYLSQRVKHNQQLADTDPLCRALGEQVLRALQATPLFVAAALPTRILPPLFNRYDVGETYGPHVDGAIRPVTGTTHRIRTDLSATLFLSAPEDYDGGELVVEDAFGSRNIKLPAGDLVLYPGTSVHHVTPVTRGSRLASFFWIQSMVRDAHQRALLFDLDRATQQVASQQGTAAPETTLANVYHNLLRLWAEI